MDDAGALEAFTNDSNNTLDRRIKLEALICDYRLACAHVVLPASAVVGGRVSVASRPDPYILGPNVPTRTAVVNRIETWPYF